MPMTHDDPRLTAYALGEASSDERAAVESALAADPTLAHEIDALRTTADALRALLGAEALPHIPPTLQQTVLTEPAAEAIVLRPRRWQRLPAPVWGSLAIAATLAAGIWAPSVWRTLTTEAPGDAVALSGTVAAPVSADDLLVGSAPPAEPPLQRGSDASGATPAPAGNPMSSPNAKVRSARNTRAEYPMDESFGGGGAAQANTERYQTLTENRFETVARAPLSTFGIDVDTASYSNVRRFLRQQQLPPTDSVRLEELLNYFSYDDAPPTDARPFAVHTEVAAAPWAPTHRLVRVALQGKPMRMGARPASNLVFLVDVSGSMQEPNKLPLVKRSLKLLVDQLDARDHVALVVYAGASGVVLPPTPANKKSVILDAIEQLEAGGGTNGAEGIKLAYDTARTGFLPGGLNRVVLATDGDFNLGVTGDGELTRVIAAQAKSGVYLSVLGFGMGNLQDSTLEQLADKGNGNYAYIDSLAEARKVLVQQAGGTLMTIAKDVKLQVEFNPKTVAGYRLLGYENRLLRAEDFRDDTTDSGELGAGHTVTALYEVIPAGQPVPTGAVDPLKYQAPAVALAAEARADELLTVNLRYKLPTADVSEPLSVTVRDGGATIAQASENLRFAAAVAEFGMLLIDSAFKGSSSFDQARTLALGARGADPRGERAEFINLLESARVLRTR